MNRLEFLKKTSAGFAAIAVAPGIWKVSNDLPKWKKYKFMPYTKWDPLAPVLKVTPDDGYYLQTYYDVPTFSPSQKYLVVTKIPFQDHWPAHGEKADVCIIDLEEQAIRKIYSTVCWEYQTGSNAQWGASDRHVYTNDVIDGTAVGIRIDIETGETKAYAGPMYNVSPDESCMVSFPLELMDASQLGVGRPSKDPLNPPTLPRGASKKQGIWKTDLNSNKKSLILSLADAAARVPKKPPQDDYTYYFWHTKFNKQGTRLCTVLRCMMPFGPGLRNPMIITHTLDGSEVYYTTPMFPVWSQGGGHGNWMPNGEYIIRHLKMDDGKQRYCKIKYDGTEFILLSQKLKGQGHETVEPREKYLITDSYSKENGIKNIELRLADLVADEDEVVCTLPGLKPVDGGKITHLMRLEGHPSWSRDYKRVTIQGAFEKKRQLYLVDLSKLTA